MERFAPPVCAQLCFNAQHLFCTHTHTHTQCNRTTALKELFTQVLHEPVKLALIGSGCSVATEPTAEVSHYYNISQVSVLTNASFPLRLLNERTYS